MCCLKTVTVLEKLGVWVFDILDLSDGLLEILALELVIRE